VHNYHQHKDLLISLNSDYVVECFDQIFDKLEARILQKINITIPNLLYGETEISNFPNTCKLSVGLK